MIRLFLSGLLVFIAACNPKVATDSEQFASDGIQVAEDLIKDKLENKTSDT